MTYVCLHCIQDLYLRQSLKTINEPCEYCESLGPSAEVSDVAAACDGVLDIHFECTNFDRSVWLYERAPTGLNLRDTLASFRFAPPSIADDLLDLVAENMEEQWFDRDSGEAKYSRDGDDSEPHFRLRSDMGGALSRIWKQMHDSLQHEARYLNPEASQVLHKVLGEIHSNRTAEGQPVVVDAGPGTFLQRLYRARTFQSESALAEALGHPANLLGTPAPLFAAAGRMNARGQPAFYGATNADVAVAEVRPPVGAWVATAAFDLVRPLKLLDLRSLGRITVDHSHSLFDPAAREFAQRRDFLRQLAEQLTQPVLPDQQERDYLVTQVMADYLATHEKGPIDGVIYPSVQKPGGLESHGDGVDAFNVALFPRASRVEGAEGPPLGTTYLWEHEDEYPGRRFLSPELFLAPLAPKESFAPHEPAPTEPRRKATLKIDLANIEVRVVRGVSISTTLGKELSIRKPL